jgi:glycosyltransferase involved in cell wall biosynthesis
MSSPFYSILRSTYRVVDDSLLARLPPRLERAIKGGVLAAANWLFPGFVSHTRVHSLVKTRSRPPAGALAGIPSWANQEALALRRDVDPSLMIDPLATPHVVQTNSAPGLSAYRKLRDALSPRHDMVLFVPWLKPGGADLGVLHYCEALVAHGQRVAVIATEASESPWAARLPRGVEFHELGDALGGLDEGRGEIRAVISRAIVECQPRAIHIVGSRQAWDAVARHGAALSQRTRLFASLFCDDYDRDGVPVGPAVQFLPDCARFLAAVLSDNSSYPDRWHSRWGVDRALFHRVPFPAPHPIPGGEQAADAIAATADLNPTTGATRPRLLWAGRFDRQKRPDVLLALAKRLPEYDWHVYGAQVVPGHGVDMSPLRRLGNVCIMGSYERFSDLLAGGYIAFIYTSQWDGLPNVLLEAARYLPIVAPAVGGIPELIEREELVASIEDIDGFVDLIRRLQGSPEFRLSRLTSQREALVNHSQAVFREHLSRVPDYLGGRNPTKQGEAQ